MKLPKTPEELREIEATRKRAYRAKKAMEADVANRLALKTRPNGAVSTATGPDLKTIVRDMVADALQDDSLDLLNNKVHQGAANLGLKAQGLIDREAQKKVTQNFWLNLYVDQQADLPQLPDGTVIEGEAVEVE